MEIDLLQAIVGHVTESEDRKRLICDHLTSLGVTSESDLIYVREEDITCVMSKIEARKAIAEWSSTPANLTSTPSNQPINLTSTPTNQPDNASTPTSSKAALNTSDTAWAFNVDLSVDKFSAEMRAILKGEKVLQAKHRLSIVRELAALISAEVEKPTKKIVDVACGRLVSKYPVLTEKIDDVVIGSGSDGFAIKVCKRLENQGRGNEPESMNVGKKRPSSPDDDRDAAKKTAVSMYGCVNYRPAIVDRAALETAKLEIITELMTKAGQENPKKYLPQMEFTFPLQRENILTGLVLESLAENWPLLFCSYGFDLHFKLLVGKSAIDLISTGVHTKGELILRYFEHCGSKKLSYILYDVEKAARRDSGGQAATAGVFMGLMEYFSEDSTLLFNCMEVSLKIIFTRLV